MSILVAGRPVPVVWRLSDLTGPDSDGHVGRFRFGKSGTRAEIEALVHHRVVGTLESMTNNTFYPTTDNVLRAGERRVSSHLGLGFWSLPGGGEELRVYQYVAFENTAYCNGQSDRDRAACTWKLWIDAGRPDANGITLSIEHEDGGALDGGDGRYVVRPEIIELSIAVDRLLLSGDARAIRAAGFHCSDAAAAQLGRIVPSKQTLIDHKVIAPVSKPYCWRPIGDDKGFPQARYIAALTGAPAPVAPSEETVKTFVVPENRTLAKVKSLTWLYDNSGLAASSGNIQIDPGRDLVYVGQFSATPDVRIVAYEPAAGDAGTSSRAYFVPAAGIESYRTVAASDDAALLAAKRAGYDLAKSGMKLTHPAPTVTWPPRP